MYIKMSDTIVYKDERNEDRLVKEKQGKDSIGLMNVCITSFRYI